MNPEQKNDKQVHAGCKKCCSHHHDHSNFIPTGKGKISSLRVDGLDCADCAKSIEKAVGETPGVMISTSVLGAGFLMLNSIMKKHLKK